MEIRLLGTSDSGVLAALALDNPDGGTRRPLAPAEAAAYLADSAVLHWVAIEAEVVGHLLCYVQRRRCDDAHQLMLYEIAVRPAYQRRGIGRALVAAMHAWMRAHAIAKVWVLAEPGDAVAFYAACGFTATLGQPVQMSMRVGSP